MKGLILVVGALLLVSSCDSASSASDGPLLAEAFRDHPLLDENEPGSEYLKVEQAVGQCMAAEGFSYAPESGPVVGTFDPQDGMSDLEFASQHGFGISSSHLGDLDTTVTVEYDTDGHADAVAASPAEQEARFVALYGASYSFGSDGSPGGCLGAALSESRLSAAEVKMLSELTSQLDEYLRSDRDVLRIERTWASCMADTGLRFSSRYQMIESYTERVNGANSDRDELTALLAEERIAALNSYRCDELVREDLRAAEEAAERQFLQSQLNED